MSDPGSGMRRVPGREGDARRASRSALYETLAAAPGDRVVSRADREYECAECHGVYEQVWSDEEAEAESKELFGEIAPEDKRIVCDDCFNRIMGRS